MTDGVKSILAQSNPAVEYLMAPNFNYYGASTTEFVFLLRVLPTSFSANENSKIHVCIHYTCNWIRVSSGIIFTCFCYFKIYYCFFCNFFITWLHRKSTCPPDHSWLIIPFRRGNGGVRWDLHTCHYGRSTGFIWEWQVNPTGCAM